MLCHFLRSQLTPRCLGIVCLKVTAKALNLNCNKNLSLLQNGFENARKSTSFSWNPSNMNAARNWNPWKTSIAERWMICAEDTGILFPFLSRIHAAHFTTSASKSPIWRRHYANLQHSNWTFSRCSQHAKLHLAMRRSRRSSYRPSPLLRLFRCPGSSECKCIVS